MKKVMAILSPPVLIKKSTGQSIKCSQNYFGETLKELRLERKLTQTEIASLLNMKQVQWCSYESGKHTPSIDNIVRICNILGIHPLTLIGKSIDKSIYFKDKKTKELSFEEYEYVFKNNLESFRDKKLALFNS